MRFLALLFFFFTVSLSCGEKVHLVWLGWPPPHLSWEEDWIKELLSCVDREIEFVVDLHYELILDNAVIVISQPDGQKYQAYFREYQKRGYKFGVIHLSDECYQHSIDFYPLAKFVIRNYWHKNLSNVLSIPLGYKRGFWKNFRGEIKQSQARKYTWSFAGQVNKSTRVSMVSNLKTIPRFHVYNIPSFADATSLSAEDYRDLLLDSTFVPCPRGFWNLDSFRLSEALECGCIPIVEKSPFDYFGKLFPRGYPFLAVSSWEQAPQLMRSLLNRPDKLEALRQKCAAWWQEYKIETKKQIISLIDDNF